MSQTKGSREDGRPDILVFLDASNGPLGVPVFAHRVGVVSALSDDGTPIVKDTDEGTLDYRCLRFHDLQKKTSQGLPDRRLTIQHFVDFGAEYASAREKDAPYEQAENFTSENRTTRWADGSGRVALPTSFSRLIGSEDGRDAVAIAFRGPVMGEPDEVDVTTDLEALNAAGLPEGVAFRNVGSEGGTGGTVTRLQPSVSVGGLTFFGGAAVGAAAKVARAGGTLQQIRDAARAAAFGLPPPPFTPEGTKTRPPAPVRNAVGGVVPNNHPLGYMWEAGVNRIGLMGTLFTSGSLDVDKFYFTGREGTPINRLAMRHDGHVAMSETRTGRVHYVPTEIAGVPEGDGEMVKGWMMHDSSVANTATEVGQETGQWRPVVRVGLKSITGLPPPPFPPPGGSFVELKDPDEEIIGGGGGSGSPSGGPTEELSPDGRFIIVRSPNGTVLGVKRVSGGILSPVTVGVVGGGGSPGPSLTAVGTAPGHLAIVASPFGNQYLIGAAAPTAPIFGLPGAPGTGGPITDSGFDGGLPLGGIPGGTPGGFGFEPQAPQTPLTTPEANAAKDARAIERETARQKALDAEQKAIDELRANGVETGGPRGRRMQERADRAQKNRDRREARREAREAFKRKRDAERAERKRKRKEKAEARRRRQQQQVDDARGTHAAGVAAAQAAAQATGLFGSVGYAVDVTDPDAPVTFGDGGLAAQDEAERKRALGGGSALGSLGTVRSGGATGGAGVPTDEDKDGDGIPDPLPNTATTLLLAPGSQFGPKNMQGWTTMATYAINSQQVIAAGAFGGRGFLNAPINVVEVTEDGKKPTGSTLGQQIIAASGQQTVFGTPPLHVVGGVHSAPGSSVSVGGAGLITVTRPQSGGGTITDSRPGVWIPPPGGFGGASGAPKPPKPADPTKPDAIVVGEGGSAGTFVVHSGGATTTTGVTVASPAGGGAKPGITIGVINTPDGKIYGTPAFGVDTIGTTTTATTPGELPTTPETGTIKTYSVGQGLSIVGSNGQTTVVGGGFLAFGTPIKPADSEGSSEGVGTVGGGYTITQQPLGLTIGATDDDGEPTGGPELAIGDDGTFITGNVSITGKLDVSGRFDPTTIEIADQVADDIPDGTAGIRYDSATNVRPLFKQKAAPYTQGPLALYSDVVGGGSTRILFSTFQATGTSITYTLPADTVTGDGNVLTIFARGETSASGGETVRFQFGGSTVLLGVVPAASDVWEARIRIIRTGASSQWFFSSGLTANTNATAATGLYLGQAVGTTNSFASDQDIVVDYSTSTGAARVVYYVEVEHKKAP